MLARRPLSFVAFAGLAISAASLIAQTAVPIPAPSMRGQPIVAPGMPGVVQGGEGKAPTAAPAIAPMPGAAIDFESLTHDFGAISDDKEVETKFKFKNSGTAEMTISSLQGSCGCTVPALDKKTYAPGESGEIAVRYNPHNRRGKQQTSVTVTSNVPDKSTVTLSVKTDVKPTILVEPQVASIGQVERGKEGKVTLMISSRKLDLEITQVTPADSKVNAVLGARIMGEIDGEKVVQFPIEVTVLPTAAVGPVQVSCTIRTNDPSRTPTFMVLGEVIGQVKAEPQRVTLGGLTAGQEMTTTFRISPRGDNPFKVTSAIEEPTVVPQPNNAKGAAGPKVFEITMAEDSSTTPASWVVTLKGKAPMEGGTFRGDIVLKTDVAGEEVVKVPYYGFIRSLAKAAPGQVSPTGKPAPNPSMLVPE